MAEGSSAAATSWSYSRDAQSDWRVQKARFTVRNDGKPSRPAATVRDRMANLLNFLQCPFGHIGWGNHRFQECDQGMTIDQWQIQKSVTRSGRLALVHRDCLK